MRDLSIFVDESGDYGTNSRFYILTMVFHEQDKPIAHQVEALANHLHECGLHAGALHTGPMIRKEDEYQNDSLTDRKRMFSALYGFMRKCDIQYKSFVIDKREYPDPFKLKARLARDISVFFQENIEYFTSFDRAIVYYDNGQAIVTNIINTTLAAIFFDVDIRRVKLSDYRLFQCADLICTLVLMKAKDERSLGMTKSEEIFFESRRKLRKNYLQQLGRFSFRTS